MPSRKSISSHKINISGVTVTTAVVILFEFRHVHLPSTSTGDTLYMTPKEEIEASNEVTKSRVTHCGLTCGVSIVLRTPTMYMAQKRCCAIKDAQEHSTKLKLFELKVISVFNVVQYLYWLISCSLIKFWSH
jgi:hypothetical protein